MKPLKSRMAWLAAFTLVLLPVLAACGPQAATPTPVAEVPTATTAPAMEEATPTTAAEEATPTTAAMEETPAAGGEGLEALAAEGIEPEPDASGRFEFFSWWTAGGEAEGKNDILNLYKELYPNIEVVDAAVAGGGGDQAKGVLKTRMQGNDPPDTFQVHAGPELLDGYVEPGRMEPVTSVYDDLKMREAYPQQLLDMVSADGEIYSVPANIHRGNVLFYNKKLFADNNLQPPQSWDDVWNVATTLKGKGIPAFAVGGKDTWAATMLFEDILLATGGPDKFNQLMSGQLDWTDTSVAETLTSLGRIWVEGHVNQDYAAVTWDEASGKVLKGEAAMTVMGDWAKGYFQANDPNWDENIGWMPTPGTDGIFKVVSDSFGLPKGAKNAENTRRFLKLIGSKVGQVTFNLRKGSIPARTDVDTSQFDVYMKDAARDFGAAKSLVGSAPHGSATTEAFASQLNTAINTFISAPANIQNAVDQLQQQAQDLLP